MEPFPDESQRGDKKFYQRGNHIGRIQEEYNCFDFLKGVLKMNKTMACEDCEAIDEAFGKMGEMQKKIAIKKITEMEESLEKLEDELTDIINTHSNILTEN